MAVSLQACSAGQRNQHSKLYERYPEAKSPNFIGMGFTNSISRLTASVMAMEIIVKECGGMTLLGKRKRIGRGSRECTDDERVKPELIQPSLWPENALNAVRNNIQIHPVSEILAETYTIRTSNIEDYAHWRIVIQGGRNFCFAALCLTSHIILSSARSSSVLSLHNVLQPKAKLHYDAAKRSGAHVPAVIIRSVISYRATEPS